MKPVLPNKQKNSRNNKKNDNTESQEKLKTIDEILEDLDNEKTAKKKKLKVRDLIEKFEVDDVEIRKKSPYFKRKTLEEKTYRHSEELTRLLEELAKVTNAPIMAPGVTTSLITNNLSDDDVSFYILSLLFFFMS